MQSLEISCGGEYINVDPSNTLCQKHLQAYDKVDTLSLQTLYLPHSILLLLLSKV